MRIISLLPAATEIVYALGLADALVGVTHECNHPPDASKKPHLVRSSVDISAMSAQEIDAVVTNRMRNGLSLYEIDEQLLTELSPDLIITQNLCQVCAPSGNELSRALKYLRKSPEIIWCSPSSISDIQSNIIEIGRTCGVEDRAVELISSMRDRIAAIDARSSKLSSRPRVLFLEWVDPPFSPGHWVPEMIEIAGGIPLLGAKHKDSVRINMKEISLADPDLIIVSPCGYNLKGSTDQARKLVGSIEWQNLRAVRDGRVFPVDADSYFARPGPRIVEGIEILSSLIEAHGGTNLICRFRPNRQIHRTKRRSR